VDHTVDDCERVAANRDKQLALGKFPHKALHGAAAAHLAHFHAEVAAHVVDVQRGAKSFAVFATVLGEDGVRFGVFFAADVGERDHRAVVGFAQHTRFRSESIDAVTVRWLGRGSLNNALGDENQPVVAGLAVDDREVIPTAMTVQFGERGADRIVRVVEVAEGIAFSGCDKRDDALGDVNARAADVFDADFNDGGGVHGREEGG